MRNSIFIVSVCAALVLVGCSKETHEAASASQDNSKAGIPANGLAMSKEELAAKADIPLYPGATVPEGQSKVTPSGAETRYEINMFTNDPVDKVAQFYKSKMKIDRLGNSTSADMMGMTSKGELAKIKIEVKDGKTHIQAITVEEKKS